MVWRFGDYGVMVLVFKRREYLRLTEDVMEWDVVVVIGPEFGKLKQWLRRTGISFGILRDERLARIGVDGTPRQDGRGSCLDLTIRVMQRWSCVCDEW